MSRYFRPKISKTTNNQRGRGLFNLVVALLLYGVKLMKLFNRPVISWSNSRFVLAERVLSLALERCKDLVRNVLGTVRGHLVVQKCLWKLVFELKIIPQLPDLTSTFEKKGECSWQFLRTYVYIYIYIIYVPSISCLTPTPLWTLPLIKAKIWNPDYHELNSPPV